MSTKSAALAAARAACFAQSRPLSLCGIEHTRQPGRLHGDHYRTLVLVPVAPTGRRSLGSRSITAAKSLGAVAMMSDVLPVPPFKIHRRLLEMQGLGGATLPRLGQGRAAGQREPCRHRRYSPLSQNGIPPRYSIARFSPSNGCYEAVSDSLTSFDGVALLCPGKSGAVCG